MRCNEEDKERKIVRRKRRGELFQIFGKKERKFLQAKVLSNIMTRRENNIGGVKMQNQTKAAKEIKRNKRQKKILKWIVIAYVIVIAIWMVLEYFVEEPVNIHEKIGSSEPYSISIKDALYIKAYSILPYVEHIQAGEYNAAYKMLSLEYREYLSYDEWLKTLEGIDFSTFDMKEIKMKAPETYVATVVYEKNGEWLETEYLLYANPYNANLITISPNQFIVCYQDLKFHKDNIRIEIQECLVTSQTIKLTAVIENTSLFSSMTFSSVGMGFDNSLNLEESVDFTLEPGEKKIIEIEYDVNYYVPNNIKIKRVLNEDTLRTYTFYFSS